MKNYVVYRVDEGYPIRAILVDDFRACAAVSALPHVVVEAKDAPTATHLGRPLLLEILKPAAD